MQSNFRRALAWVAALTMLCTLLPLGTISVAAAGTIANADFETGSVGSLPNNWKAYDSSKQAQISNVDAHGGTQSAILAWRNQRFVLYQDVAVEKNYSYTVTFWYRSTRTSSSQGTTVNYTFGAYDTAAKGNVLGSGGTYIDAAATEITTDYHTGSWTQMTYTFNSGSNTTVRLGFAGASSSSTFTAADGHILIDDLAITGTPIGGGDEGDDGEQSEAIYADDFEDGIDGWSGGGDGTVELVTASDLPVANPNSGNNAMKITSVYYNYFSDKASFKVERDTDYIFTFDILSGSAGRPVKAIVGTNSWFSTQVVVETYTPVTTEWQTIRVKFNSGANTTLYLGWQASWDTGTYYVDNVSVTKAPEVEETDNLVLNGSFEDDETNWNVKNCTHSIVSDAQDGSKALQISGITAQYAEAALSNVISTTPGNIYTIKWWSKRISNDTGAFNLYINGSHTKVSGQNWMNKAASAGWIEHEYVIKANDDCRSIQLKFSTEISGGNPGTILIDNVQVYEQKQPSFDGWLYNGDFECGETTNWEVHQGTLVSRDAKKNGKYGLNLKGDGSYGGMANQTITTEVGKIYLLSMWMKANTNGTNFKVTDANGEKLASTWFNKTEWTYQEFEFTATSTTTKLNFSGGGNGIAEDIYVDDIRIVELKEPSCDGYIYNGDFEAGSLVKWKSYQSTALSASAAHSGNYGVHIYGDANWGGLLNQTFAVEAGKTYKVSFWYRGWSNGVNFSIKDGDEKLVSKYFSFKYASGWEYYEATFEAGYATSLQFTISGSGLATTTAGQGTHDECYVDDIKIENLSGDEIDRNELQTDGGTSIRDVDDDSRGLAFKFDLIADGIQVVNGNEYVAGSGTLDLFKYSDDIGNLVEFGAIVSNDATVGAGDMTLENVDGNGKTVKVPAKYLMELEETSAAFAVRVINIPEDKVHVQIYARPYYTYELNGEQVTVYGATNNDSYEHVSSIRRSLKILAIGNSFSVDAMKNHLYDILKSADYDQVVLGNLYIGGCSLDTHWNNMDGGLSAYQYQKNDDNGQWVYTENATALSALKDEMWDIITIQQASPDSGRGNTYGNLQNIVNWVNENKTNDDAQVLWHMTWAYQQNSDHEGFANYGNNQMTMYNAIVNAVQSNVLTVNGIDGVIPAGTAIQNLRTSGLGDTLTADGYHLSDTYGDYTAALTWYRAITGESLDLVTYWPDSVKNYRADIMQAAARAVHVPYAVSDLSETIILGLSDFQASTDEKGADQVQQILSGGIAQKYSQFDGLFAVGDYSAAMGYDVALTGIQALDKTIDPYVSGNKIYTEGNHDAPDLPGLSPTGNNDPEGGKYGVFVINEEDYDQFGEGGEATAAMMQAYFNEKLADPNWGNKPIFVLCHVPLHYSMRTETSNSGKTARPMVDVLNEAGANGLNILFLFGHNHSGGYDDFLGAGSVYLKKGDSMIVPQYGDNYKYNWDTVTLNFTYMNVGYVGYNADNGYGADVALTVTTYRIQSNGDVIITRWDKDGEHNLKSKGVQNTVLQDTFAPDETVYESSRVVTADDDRKYEGD